MFLEHCRNVIFVTLDGARCVPGDPNTLLVIRWLVLPRSVNLPGERSPGWMNGCRK